MNGRETSSGGPARRGRGRRAAVPLAVALALAVVLGACGPPPVVGPPVGPEDPVWMVGDSIASGTGNHMNVVRPHVAAVGGAGWTDLTGTSIGTNTEAFLAASGATPATVLIIGGVNDLAANAPVSVILDRMAEFEAAMTARGAKVVWIKEPAWARAPQMPPLYEWIDSRERSVDCLAYAGPHAFGDPDHPQSYTAFAACVERALADIPGLVLG